MSGPGARVSDLATARPPGALRPVFAGERVEVTVFHICGALEPMSGVVLALTSGNRAIVRFDRGPDSFRVPRDRCVRI